jgi:cysteine-S-conjugate beta-lyase
MERESMHEGANPFDACTLADLRQRRSEKWATYPPDVLPAFVAEMDVALADPIRQTLIAAIARGDTGYAHPAGLTDAFADFARAWFNWAVDPEWVVLVPDVMVGASSTSRSCTPHTAGSWILSGWSGPFVPGHVAICCATRTIPPAGS